MHQNAPFRRRKCQNFSFFFGTRPPRPHFWIRAWGPGPPPKYFFLEPPLCSKSVQPVEKVFHVYQHVLLFNGTIDKVLAQVIPAAPVAENLFLMCALCCWNVWLAKIGYEVSRQHDVTAHNDPAAGSPWRSTSHVGPSSAARRPESLATRREAVELLSCEAPLLSYLVQNGAVSRLDAELIERETASSARQNITLLRCVDRAGRAGLALLLNALRLTGQHQLANLLDYTPRIVPLTPGVESTSCTPGEGNKRASFVCISAKLLYSVLE